jgi:hypothetical protein
MKVILMALLIMGLIINPAFANKGRHLHLNGQRSASGVSTKVYHGVRFTHTRPNITEKVNLGTAF